MYKHPLFKVFSFVLIALLAGLASCELIKGPNFPLAPRISFEKVDVKRNIIEPTLGNRVDEVTVVLHFEDGDGDLGLSSEDRENDSRYQFKNSDGTLNRYYYNYFAKGFRKVNGEYVEINAGVPYVGAFPRLNPDGKPGPIEGDLEYSLLFPLLETPPNDTLRFEIQIIDRALRESNVILTEPVVVNKK